MAKIAEFSPSQVQVAKKLSGSNLLLSTPILVSSSLRDSVYLYEISDDKTKESGRLAASVSTSLMVAVNYNNWQSMARVPEHGQIRTDIGADDELNQLYVLVLARQSRARARELYGDVCLLYDGMANFRSVYLQILGEDNVTLVTQTLNAEEALMNADAVITRKDVEDRLFAVGGFADYASMGMTWVESGTIVNIVGDMQRTFPTRETYTSLLKAFRDSLMIMSSSSDVTPTSIAEDFSVNNPQFRYHDSITFLRFHLMVYLNDCIQNAIHQLTSTTPQQSLDYEMCYHSQLIALLIEILEQHFDTDQMFTLRTVLNFIGKQPTVEAVGNNAYVVKAGHADWKNSNLFKIEVGVDGSMKKTTKMAMSFEKLPSTFRGIPFVVPNYGRIGEQVYALLIHPNHMFDYAEFVKRVSTDDVAMEKFFLDPTDIGFLSMTSVASTSHRQIVAGLLENARLLFPAALKLIPDKDTAITKLINGRTEFLLKKAATSASMVTTTYPATTSSSTSSSTASSATTSSATTSPATTSPATSLATTSSSMASSVTSSMASSVTSSMASSVTSSMARSVPAPTTSFLGNVFKLFNTLEVKGDGADTDSDSDSEDDDGH